MLAELVFSLMILAAIVGPHEVPVPAEEEVFRSFIEQPTEIPQDCQLPGDKNASSSLIAAVEEELAKRAKASGLHKEPELAERLELLEQQSLLATLQRNVASEIEVTEEEIDQYVASAGNSMATTETALFEYVFAAVPSPEEEEGKHELMEQVLQVAEEGETLTKVKLFAERLGLQTSQTLIAASPGRLGAAVEEAILGKKGTGWTKITRTPHGWHLFFVESYTPARTPEPDEVRSRAQMTLAGKKLEEAAQEIIADHKIKGSEGKEDTDFLLAEARERGLDESEAYRTIRRIRQNHELATAFLLHEAGKVEAVEEEEIRALYEKGRDEWMTPKKWGVLALALAKPEFPEAVPPSEAAAQLQALRNDLQTVRAAYQESGDLGLALESVPEERRPRVLDYGKEPMGVRGIHLDLAVQDLKGLEMSHVVSLPNAYHLYLVTVIEEPRPMTWEEARAQLQQRAQALNRQEVINKAICEALRSVL